MKLEIIKRKSITELRQIGLNAILEEQARITARQVLGLVKEHLGEMAFLLDDKDWCLPGEKMARYQEKRD